MMAIIKEKATPQSQPDLDKWRLLRYTVDPIGKELVVYLALGYEDGGNFVIKQAPNYTITGEDFDSIYEAEGETGTALSESLEEAIWTYLEAQGYVDLA
jgi:hypothetical protein